MQDGSAYAADAHGLVVQGDAARLSQLFRTLAEQSLARDAERARIVVSQRNGCAEIAFEDQGAALSDDARASFVVVQLAAGIGLGLRLLIAKAIVEGHAGTLSVDGADAKVNHRFRCTLPLA